MSDQNSFINAYVENTISTLHDYLNQILQLKAQLKVSSDRTVSIQSELDAVRLQLEKTNASNAEKDGTIQKMMSLEQTNQNLQNKVVHLDTALNQINDMRATILKRDREIQQKNQEIESLKKELADRESNKKTLNKKKIKDIVSMPINIIDDFNQNQKTDDF